MSRDRTRCPHCGKFLIPYIKSSDLCQLCYRELLKKYSYYEYRPNVEKPRLNSKAHKIVELAYNEHLDSREISKLTNSHQLYVISVVKKYLYRCDVNGKPRPSYMGEK